MAKQPSFPGGGEMKIQKISLCWFFCHCIMYMYIYIYCNMMFIYLYIHIVYIRYYIHDMYCIMICYTAMLHNILPYPPQNPVEGQGPSKRNFEQMGQFVFECGHFSLHWIQIGSTPHTGCNSHHQDDGIRFLRLGEIPTENRLIWPRLNPSILNTYLQS